MPDRFGRRSRARTSAARVVDNRGNLEGMPAGRLHRVTRLLALAIRCEVLIESSVLRDYTDVASLGRVSKPRVTQVMNLLNLAPDLQELLLFLPPTTLKRDRISERQLRSVVKLVDWSEQRKLFTALFPGLEEWTVPPKGDSKQTTEQTCAKRDACPSESAC